MISVSRLNTNFTKKKEIQQIQVNMDLQKAKKLLNKITALYQGMESDPDSIATIEKDLMRSYVRQFYEHFLENENNSVVASAAPKKKAAPVKASPKPLPPAPKPVAPVYEKPRVIELSEEVQEFVEETVEPTPPAPAPSPAPKPIPRTPVVKKVKPSPAPAAIQDEEVSELFTERKASDLSEKLSSLPVTDLLKTMGLNERILTVNELFGGDANAFKKVMTDLNALSNFEEAKSYLAANVVSKYGWTKRGKKNKAKVLIKTIRRRYA